MKPDGMLVEAEMIAEELKGIGRRGTDGALEELAAHERDLTAYITISASSIAGKLALAGAPTEVVRGSHEDFLLVILACIGAMKRGHYQLWKDTLVGSRLADIDHSLVVPVKKGRRRKGQTSAPSGPHE